MILSKLTAMILSSTLLSGCANWDATSTQTDVQAQLADACTTHIVNYTETDTAPNWQTSDYTSIICNGSEAEISGNGAASDANGITISQAGTYVLSGTLTDGTLTIDAPSDALVTVVLNGVSLSCSDSAPFYAKQADKTVVVLANGTENILSDGEIYQYPDPETDEPNAALFSKDDLTITGSGMLTVLGQYNNGIGTKDDLKITDGTITVISTDDGLVGKDSVGISGGTISINAQGDGIKSSQDADTEKGFIRISGGNISIQAAGDGMQAATCIHYDDGTTNITAGGGAAAAQPQQNSGPGHFTAATETQEDTPSTKGVKGDGMVTISGGSLTVDSQDDAVHSNNAIMINDGTLFLTTGDDGIHADQSLAISGGTISIPTCYEGLESAVIDISGGDITLTASDDGINAAGGEDENIYTPSNQDIMPEQNTPPNNSENAQPQPPNGSNPMFTNGEQSVPPADQPEQVPQGQQPPAIPGEDSSTLPQGGYGGRGGGMPVGMGQGNSNNTLSISGGSISICASGDGIDTNGSFTMTGGIVTINGPESNGDSALDYDGSFDISGGTLIAAGGIGMMQAPSATSTQSSIVATFSTPQSADTTVELLDNAGNSILQCTPSKQFQSLIISCPSLLIGNTYSININGGNWPSFTLENILTYVSETGVSDTPQGGQMGGGMGGRGPGARGQENHRTNAQPNIGAASDATG